MFASFVAMGLSVGAMVVVFAFILVPMFVSALRTPVDVDYLDPKNCRDC